MGQSWWKIASYLRLLKRKETLNEALFREFDVLVWMIHHIFCPLCFSGELLFKGCMRIVENYHEANGYFLRKSVILLINVRIIRGINCSIQCQLHLNINLAQSAKAVAVANANDFHHCARTTAESLAALWIDWHSQVVFGLVGSFNAFTTILAISNNFTLFSTVCFKTSHKFSALRKMCPITIRIHTNNKLFYVTHIDVVVGLTILFILVFNCFRRLFTFEFSLIWEPGPVSQIQ